VAAVSAAADLLARAREGDKRSIARLVSVVENDEPGAAEAMRVLYPETGRARVVGVTGPPGGGKSTLVSRLVAAYRGIGERVAVVAVDPSSHFTGGAILGDRIRMRESFLDEGLFIRSMASRGHAGGVARATMRVVHVFDALGASTVIVETVGVGQEEVDVVRVADTVCLVTVPGLGDDIQAIKAGVLEIADVLVVNKADRPGADETVRDLAMMLSLGKAVRPAPAPSAPGERGPKAWKPPILRTSAVSGEGTAELIAAIAEHGEWSRENGERERRRREAARAEVETLLRETLVRQVTGRIGTGAVDAVVARVAAREIDPYAAVDGLLSNGRHL
jgi:LAO/AO transport system kinase